MIDRPVFAQVMGMFADRIGRPLAPITAEAYYAELSDRLDTEEFRVGARIVFRAHQFNTWPVIQQFIDAAKPKPSAELAAAETFERILRITGNGDRDEQRRKIAEFGPIAERAFRAAGGFRDFTMVLEKDVPFIRERFVQAFTDSADDAERHEDVTRALAANNPVAQLVQSTAKVLSLTGRDRALPTGDQS